MGSVNTGLTNWTSRCPLGLWSFHIRSEAFTWGWNLLMYSFFLGFSPRKSNVLLIFICSPATRVPNWILPGFVLFFNTGWGLGARLLPVPVSPSKLTLPHGSHLALEGRDWSPLFNLAHHFQNPQRNTAVPAECCRPAWRCSHMSGRRRPSQWWWQQSSLRREQGTSC